MCQMEPFQFPETMFPYEEAEAADPENEAAASSQS